LTNNLSRLDDEDYPAVSMGQAAELLGVQPAFPRSLDTSGALHPYRTDGGHRRYSRRQLTHAARLRELLDAGHTLVSAQAITDLEQQLDEARRDIAYARGHATEELDAARAALRTRTDALAAARGELEDAREQITELNNRIR
jgi:MerR family transcriptional regulator, heat shock protein HspR